MYAREVQCQCRQWVSWQFRKWVGVVFTGPIGPKKWPKLNWTQLQRTGSPVAVALILKFFSCQLQGLSKNWKTEKNQSKLVATSLSFRYMLDLTHAHIYLIFGPWIIKNGQELVEIWPKTFLYAIQMYVLSVFTISQSNLNEIAWSFNQSTEN